MWCKASLLFSCILLIGPSMWPDLRVRIPSTSLSTTADFAVLLSDGLHRIACELTQSKPSRPEMEIRYPDPDIGVDSLPGRKKAQMETVDQFKVFYQFQFADKLKQSGITFVHHAVEDATKNYMLSHYDHGNGIAVADVDGDGLYDIYFVNQVGGNQLWKSLGGGTR